MTSADPPLPIDQILAAVEAVKRERPAYADILDFYGPLFAAQAASAERVRIAAIRIPDHLLAAKQEGGLPLIAVSEFAVDTVEAERLLVEICRLAADIPGALGQTADSLKTALEDGRVDGRALFRAVLEQGDADLATEAERLGVEPAELSLLAFSAIQPSVSSAAGQLADYLDSDAEWDKGYCPVCGNSPGLVLFTETGRRRPVCGFCGHRWTAKRIGCLFCGNRQPDTLHYFYSEDESGCRVDLCDACKRYLKGVDTRHISRPIYPPLEQVASLHLDMKAIEQGYRNETVRIPDPDRSPS